MAEMRGDAACTVCPRHCNPQEGQYGFCGARKREGGRMACANYGKVTALALDPIEKKPLRRFYPGSAVLSVGSFGCSLSCPFCQNHEIAMAGRSPAAGRGSGMGSAPAAGEDAVRVREEPPCRDMTPEELAALAFQYRGYGNVGVAFTYNEPLVGYEFVRDTARLVHGLGMKNILVTNGYGEDGVLEELLPWVDAMNIDLKGFTDGYYRKLGGGLGTVKRFIERAAKSCHVELTTLIVPGENDSTEEMEEEAQWIASLDPEIPLHVTRFFPRYRMRQKEPTAVEAVYRLRDAAGKYLRYVYAGNC